MLRAVENVRPALWCSECMRTFYIGQHKINVTMVKSEKEKKNTKIAKKNSIMQGDDYEKLPYYLQMEKIDRSYDNETARDQVWDHVF